MPVKKKTFKRNPIEIKENYQLSLRETTNEKDNT